MQTTLGLDFENFCEESIKDIGLSRYTRHPSNEPLMLAFKFRGRSPEQVVFAEGQKISKGLRKDLTNPRIIKTAWNAAYERRVLADVIGIHVPIDQWRCTMTHAMGRSLPGKLSKAGEALGLAVDKQKDRRGDSLIRRFCFPRKPTKNKPWTRATRHTDPVEWEEFKGYNLQDSVAEEAIADYLMEWPMTAYETELWYLDQEINDRGFPVHRRSVEKALKYYSRYTKGLRKEIGEITGLDNPNSRDQLLGWLQDRGYKFEDLKKGHIDREAQRFGEKLVKAKNPRKAHRAREVMQTLHIRQELSRTSVQKFAALDRIMDADDRVRHIISFYGAGRTGRWSSRQFQVHNLSRPAKKYEKNIIQCVTDLLTLRYAELVSKYPQFVDYLSACVRPMIQAEDGKILVDIDLSAIENVVLGWLAGDPMITEVFRQGKDPYIAFAVHMYGGSYKQLFNDYKRGDGTKRTMCKPAVLGCGYGLGPGKEFEDKKTGEITGTGLIGYALGMGIKMTPAQAEKAVKIWRRTHKKTVRYWYKVGEAAIQCVKSKKKVKAGKLTFEMSGDFLLMRLPSGRCLYYYKPEIRKMKTPWGEKRPTLTYMGIQKNQWLRLSTHPGKLIENAVQAIARDVLASGMKRASDKGVVVVAHVHDQVLAEHKKKKGELAMELLRRYLTKPPKWAEGMPLRAAGHLSPVFLKD